MVSGPIRFVALISIVLVLNLAICDLALAANGSEARPDSSLTNPKVPAMLPEGSLARDESLVTSGDSLASDSDNQANKGQQEGARGVPIYKKRWLWATAGGVLLIALVALAAGAGEKTESDLPGFPEPPQR